MAVGGKIVVDRGVTGDATLAAGSVEVLAAVGDDMRVVGGDVNISSTVGGELFATGGNVTLSRAARIGHGASLFGGVITIDGIVEGPLEIQAQKVIINGPVSGDADLSASEIELGQNAKIGGALNYNTPGEMRRQDSNPNRYWQRHGWFNSPPGAAWGLSFIALLACTSVFLLVFPAFSERASDGVGTKPLLALLVGFGTLVGVPTFVAMLFISLLGIPVGILVLALCPALILLGYLVGVLFVSRRAQSAMQQKSPTSTTAAIGFFALALLLVMLLGRLPFVGGLLIGIITVFGVGASVLALTQPPPVQPNTPASGLPALG